MNRASPRTARTRRWARSSAHGDFAVPPHSVAGEHAVELAQPVEADTDDDALRAVVTSGHGTDADAGEYLND